MAEILSNVDQSRKLLVSAKNWDGKYEPERQKYGYRTYNRIADVLFTNPWSPIIFKGGVRGIENFISSDWFALDYDDHQLNIDQACKNFVDFQYVIATTKSHTKDNHCFRVCIPWEQRITDRDDYVYNLTKMAEAFESDLNALGPSRFFWPCIALYRVNTDGEMMPVRPEPPYEKELRKLQTAYQLQPLTEITTRAQKFLEHGKLIGSNGRNSTILKIAKDLARAGWTLDDAVAAIERAPFPREDFGGRQDDIRRIATNSYNYIERRRREQQREKSS